MEGQTAVSGQAVKGWGQLCTHGASTPWRVERRDASRCQKQPLGFSPQSHHLEGGLPPWHLNMHLKRCYSFLPEHTAPRLGPLLGKWGKGWISAPALRPWPGVWVQSTAHTVHMGILSTTGGNSLEPGIGHPTSGQGYRLLFISLLFKCLAQDPENYSFHFREQLLNPALTCFPCKLARNPCLLVSVSVPRSFSLLYQHLSCKVASLCDKVSGLANFLSFILG